MDLNHHLLGRTLNNDHGLGRVPRRGVRHRLSHVGLTALSSLLTRVKLNGTVDIIITGGLRRKSTSVPPTARDRKRLPVGNTSNILVAFTGYYHPVPNSPVVTRIDPNGNLIVRRRSYHGVHNCRGRPRGFVTIR